jgi:RND family efflux transporter MFP subunit
MQLRLLVGLLVSLFIWGCGMNDSSEEKTPAGGSITLWTEKTELFLEYPALIAGREARFAAHLTRLSDFKPCIDEAVRFRFQGAGSEIVEHTVDSSASPGIYRPRITFGGSGAYDLTIIVSGKTTDTLKVGTIQVYPSLAAIAVEEGSASKEQLITFLKEQQWKTEFRTTKVERRMISQVVRAPGEILARKDYDVVVSAPFTGTLQPEHNRNIPVVGRYLQRGSVLATLTSAPQTIDGGENFASLYAEAEGGYRLAKSEFERAQQLHAKGSISTKEHDEARAGYEKARANLDAFSRSVQRDTVNPQRPGEYNFLLRAPISGTIAEVSYVLGRQFQSGDQLFRIVNTSVVWLLASVPVAEMGRVSHPRRAEFRVTGMPEPFDINERNGRLISIGSVVDERTRSVPVIFEVANPKGVLRIGLFADVLIKTGMENPVAVVPKAALIEDEGRYSVYVHIEGEAFARREVELGGREGDWVEVRSGLNLGERVVSVGAYQVRLASLSTQLPAHGHEH